jgi:hypothetical protein
MDVRLNGLSSTDVSRLVWELRNEHNLQAGEDYDFYYHPAQQPRWDDELNEFVPKHTLFTFRDPAVGVWFALKWA